MNTTQRFNPANTRATRPQLRHPPTRRLQSVYELSDGSGLVLTVGKYVTPSGVDIDREGLRPDFRTLPQPADADAAIAACRLQRGAAAPVNP